MTISRKKKQAPAPPPPPKRVYDETYKARFNAAGLILDSAAAVVRKLRDRGMDAKSAAGQRALELAGMCLANGGEIEDAVAAAANWLEQNFGPAPEPKAATPGAGLTLAQLEDDQARQREVARQLEEFRRRIPEQPTEEPFDDIPL